MAETAFKLESPDFHSFPVNAAVAYTAGDLEKIEDTTGVIVATVITGEDTALVYKAAKIRVKKSVTSGQNAWTKGDKLYLDEAEKAVCDSASGNILTGIALEDRVAADTDALVEWDGNMAIVA